MSFCLFNVKKIIVLAF